MNAPIIRHLAQQQWRRTCTRDSFCFRCWLPFCRHCCTHWDLHHPGPPARHQVALVRVINGGAAILSEWPVPSGFDWTKIRRIKKDARQWIPLNPPLVPIAVGPACHNQGCNSRTRRGTWYCSALCKALTTEGDGADMVHELANADFAQHLLRDRYCRLCWHAFVSDSCPDHAAVHHPGAGAPEDIVVEVIHHNGWACVEPSNLVPLNVLQGVQAINLGGVEVYPLQRRAGPLIQPAGGHGCAANCPQQIPHGFVYCSLDCKGTHQAVW